MKVAFVLAFGGAAALVGACAPVASTATPFTATARRSVELRFADSSNEPLLYATQFRATSVNAYAAHGSGDRAPVCTIPNVKEVNGIGVDPSGTLWVPQQNSTSGTQSILSFGPHCGAQGITLKDPDGFPTAIAFDSAGTNYVMNAQTYPSAYGDVQVFPKGRTRPSLVLTDPAFRLLTAVGVDSRDNVYVMTAATGSSGMLVEFKHGRMPGIDRKKVTTDGIPGGTLLFDRAGNLLVDDYGNAVLYVYAPPYNATPKRVPLPAPTWQCAFNRSETKLACADTGNGTVDVFGYPSLPYEYSIKSGLAKVATVAGVAFDPSSTP